MIYVANNNCDGFILFFLIPLVLFMHISYLHSEMQQEYFAPTEYSLDYYVQQTFNWLTNPAAYLDRYYTKHYFLADSGTTEAYCVRQAPNKLCIITLAPNHPILKDRLCPISFEFRGNKSKGKKTQALKPEAIICTIRAGAGDMEMKFNVSACVKGDLVEINERLSEDPSIIFTKPESEGYIAIVKPKVEDSTIALANCVSEEEWKTRVENIMNINTI